jgi:hypothetical protein
VLCTSVLVPYASDHMLVVVSIGAGGVVDARYVPEKYRLSAAILSLVIEGIQARTLHITLYLTTSTTTRMKLSKSFQSSPLQLHDLVTNDSGSSVPSLLTLILLVSNKCKLH